MSDRTPTGDPWLLTPGPLTTTPSVKRAMQRDVGSRDLGLLAVNRRIGARLLEIADATTGHVCVLLQGSGTFVVEAMVGTFVPGDGHLLVVVNGAYGHRMADIARVVGRRVSTLKVPEAAPFSVAALADALKAAPDVTHVAVVQCETTTGVLNPVEAAAEVVSAAGAALLVDAMSAFGALPLAPCYEALVASSNKCLQGVPGVGFCIARADAIAACEGRAHSLSLDLYDQWRRAERDGQWRFTPPTHALLALDQALVELEAEGGVAARGARYAENGRILAEGMRALGFSRPLADADQAPIIYTFLSPADPAFVFDDFYERMRARGYVIYPGKLTQAETFRVGCIGALHPTQMRAAVGAIGATLEQMGVRRCAPEES